MSKQEESFKLDTSLPIEDVAKLPEGEADVPEPFQSWTDRQLAIHKSIWDEQMSQLGVPSTMASPPFGLSALQYASVMEQLKLIQSRYPNVLKAFIDNHHYGK